MKAISALSSGVTIDAGTLRGLMALKNSPGLYHFTLWLVMLAADRLS